MNVMEIKLLDKAQQILDLTIQGMQYTGQQVATAADFAQQQLPLLAQEYIIYARAYSSTKLLIGTIVWALTYHFIVNVGIKNRYNLPADPRSVVATVGGFFTLVLGSFIVIPTLKEFFMCWFAPHIFLIQELARLLK